MSDSVISFDINFKDLEKVQELLTKVKADASEEIKINVKATGNNINKLDKDVKNFNKDLGQTSKKFSEIFEKGKSLTLAFGKGIFAGGLALGAAAIGNLSSNKFTSKEARASELYLSSKELIALQKAGRYAGQDENFLVNAADTVSTKSRQVDQTGNFAAFGVNGLQDKSPLEQLQIIMDTYSEKYNSSTDKAYRDQLTQKFSQLTGIGYQTASKIAESGGWEGNFKDNYIDALSRLKEINTEALKEGERIMDTLSTELSQSLAEISAALVPILKEVVSFLVPAIGKLSTMIANWISKIDVEGIKEGIKETAEDVAFYWEEVKKKFGQGTYAKSPEEFDNNLKYAIFKDAFITPEGAQEHLSRYVGKISDLPEHNRKDLSKNADYNKDGYIDRNEYFVYRMGDDLKKYKDFKQFGITGSGKKAYEQIVGNEVAEKFVRGFYSQTLNGITVNNNIEIIDKTTNGVKANTTATASEAMVSGANNSLTP